jgi:hypothetical protein
MVTPGIGDRERPPIGTDFADHYCPPLPVGNAGAAPASRDRAAIASRAGRSYWERRRLAGSRPGRGGSRSSRSRPTYTAPGAPALVLSLHPGGPTDGP